MPESQKSSQSFVSRFEEKVDEFPGGKELLQRLEQTTCGAGTILRLLEAYCGAQVNPPLRTSIKEHSSRRRSLADRFDEVSNCLTEAAADLERINVEHEMGRWVQFGGRPFGSPAEIRSWASQLATISKKLREVSLRTRPMEALSTLAAWVRGSNEKDDYHDLSLLLEIGYAALGVEKTLTAEDVTRLLKRARTSRHTKMVVVRQPARTD